MKDQWIKIFEEAEFGNGYTPTEVYNSAVSFINLFQKLDLLKPKDKILDLGCGNGRLGIPLSVMDVEYVGIDPCDKSIIFCKRAFKDFSHLQFQHIDIRCMPFNPNGMITPKDLIVPHQDTYFDIIIASSLFTHLATLEIANHYFAEILRVLKPAGYLFTSWFRSPPNDVNYTYGRTVYKEIDIINMLRPFNLIRSGGGTTKDYHDQWAIFAQKL